jgi:tetratricopeptide (TPR) repeat protein
MHASSPHRARGDHLFRMGRMDQAEREYRMAVSDDPRDPIARSMLAQVIGSQGGRHDEALREARDAIALAPDLAFGHRVEAGVHLEGGRFSDGERAAREAVRLDPEDEDNFAMLSHALQAQRRWAEALAAADTGLELSPVDPQLLNLRAQALVGLGRKDEAGATLRGALARDPENADTHANQGWALLHRGDRKGALGHFRESLRLDPQGEWARAGLVEALKAGNPVYAAMLRYFLWMQRMDRRTQRFVILGGFVGYHVTRTMARDPALAPWLTPLMVAYVVFVLLTWIAPQLFSAVLLASRDGRYALSDEQRRSGVFMAAGAGAALALGTAYLLTRAGWAENGAILAAVLLIPLASVFRGPRGRPTRKMAMLAGALYALAALSVALTAAGLYGPAGTLFIVVLLASIATSWIVGLRG